jgi:hypothetical protein
LAFWSSGELRAAMFTFAALPPLATIVAYFIWVFRDPDRLQSERFQVTRAQYALLGDNRIRRDLLMKVIEGSPSVPGLSPGDATDA